MYLYLRYIDDQNMALKHLAPGTRWTRGPWADGLGGKMLVVEEHVKDDELLPADMRTMLEVRKMADSICQMIQLEEDYASKHDNQQLAILDLNVKVKLVMDNQVTRPKLYYTYSRKEAHGKLAANAR